MKFVALVTLLTAVEGLASVGVAVLPMVGDPSPGCRADALLAARLGSSPVARIEPAESAEWLVAVAALADAWRVTLERRDGSKKIQRDLSDAQGCDDVVLAAHLIVERALRELGPVPFDDPDLADPDRAGVAPPAHRAWGLTATGALRAVAMAFGGGLHAHVRITDRWQMGVLASITTGDVSTVTIDGLTRGTMTMTPGTVWLHAGPCFGSTKVKACPELVAGVRLWQARAAGEYLFQARDTWAANPLVGLAVSGRVDLPLHLLLELGAVGLWAPLVPVFGIAGTTDPTFSPPPLEVDFFVGLGFHFD